MFNYEETIFSKKDISTLIKIYKNKGVDIDLIDPDTFSILMDYDLIQYDYRNNKRYVIVTSNYKRFIVSKRNRFIERKFPIIISIIALIVSIAAFFR